MPQLEERVIDGRTWRRCPTCGRYRGYNTCRWCGRRYKKPAGLRRHEALCYNNPGRECAKAGRTNCIDCPDAEVRAPDPCDPYSDGALRFCGEREVRVERMAQLCDLGLVEGADGGPYRLTSKGEEWQAKGGGWPEDAERELMEANANAPS